MATDRFRLLRHPGRGSVGVALVLVAAGFLFSTSAQTARGTQLRSERVDVTSLIQAERGRLDAARRRASALQAENERDLDVAATTSSAVMRLRRLSEPLLDDVGTRPVHGPALIVTLDDAPRDKPVPADAGPDDLVVHQQDVQAVVNALWAGGAEAMMLQDQRVISTSAVRCVGNTLILQGRVYSPPYTVTAVGDVEGMRRALDASPEVNLFLQYVASLNLGWEVQQRQDLTLPGYDGPLALTHARAAGAVREGAGPAPTVSSSP